MVASRAWWVAVFALLLFVSSTATGFADSSEESKAPQTPLPSSQEIGEAIEAEGPESISPDLTDPNAAEAMAHKDLGRSEALELLEAVFPAQLQTPAGVFDELHVEKFLADNVAVIAPGQQPEAVPSAGGEEAGYEGATLMDSTVPLRVESSSGEKEAVDLSLEQVAGGLRASNPLVEVNVPQELGEGIDLPESGVRIKLAGAPHERSPSTLDSAAFYPSVAEDTDFTVALTPTAVETLTQLRSPEAPHSQTYNLQMPVGAALQATENGGAEVKKGDETLIGIAPPTAIDAAGSQVPVSLEVSGDSLTLEVSPEESTKFPILLDPLFQTYEWYAKNNHNGIYFNGQAHEQWWAPGAAGANWLQNYSVPWSYVPLTSGMPGLYIASTGSAKVGDEAALDYAVPRYFTDYSAYGTRPTSFISHMTFSNLVWQALGSYPSPYLFAGIWDPVGNSWVSYYTHEGNEGHSLNDMSYPYQFSNPNNTNAKVGILSLHATETRPSGGQRVYVGTATIELGESQTDVPGFGSISGPSQWLNQSPGPVSFTASDSGLGVYALIATDEKNLAHSWKTPYGCVGVGDSACPHTWKSTETGHPALSYDPSVFPQGINYLKVIAEDPLGHVSEPAYAQLKIDHTAPDLSLSGPLTEQLTLGKKLASYKLKINAVDGTEAYPQSGVAKTVVEVDGKVVDEKAPGCSTQNCSVSREWPLEASQFSVGAHTVKVTATDAVGLSTSKSLSIELQASPPPSISLSGTMTEQGVLGTSRPRYQLKASTAAESGGGAVPLSGPTFSLSFGTSGANNGEFAHPAGMAVDSKGNLWVVDQNHYRVQKFNEAGTYLSSFGTQGSGNGQFGRPTDIAVDAKGNLWVTDAWNNRIEEFNEKGEYLTKVGTLGSGNLQFNGPESIAIDSKGNIWVGDTYNGRLQELNQKGEFVRSVATHGSGAGQIGQSTGVAIGPGGNVWVADWEYNRVVEFSETGTFIRQFGSAGSGNGQFSHPDVIDVDTAGNVWVGDQNNNRIQEFNQSGEYVTQFGAAGSGTGQFSFGWPMGLASDFQGRLWIADTGNSRVQRWQISDFTAKYASSFGSTGSATGQFNHPGDVAIDSKGNLWVVDKFNSRIEEFTESGGSPKVIGSSGSTGGKLVFPTGIAIDPAGNIWVTDTGNIRVEEFNEKGEFLATFGTNVNKTKVESGGTQAEKNLCTAASKNVCQAGTAGSLEGQMKSPMGIAVSPGGNLFVVEKGNSRVEKFSPTGEVLANFGTLGSGTGQLKEPTAVAIAPDGSLWVADTGNNRVAEWTSTYAFVRQFSREFIHPDAIEVDPLGNVLVGDQGNSRIQEFNENAQFLTSFGASGTGSGQFTLSDPVGIAVNGKGGIWVTDTNNDRIEKWTQQIPRSEITAKIAVDGKQISTGKAICSTENCPLAPEWTLESPSYSVGKHAVEVTATDGLGRTTTKTLSVEITRDTTKPTLEASGKLFEAPEGWVEQESYPLNATATDAGYGLSSLIAKIDGSQVASWTSSCPDGGCKATISKSINMAAYAGGSHAAEIVATDGAGNTTTKHWTINVDPEGHVTASEVEDTLEAVEETSDANPVGTAKEEGEFYGTRSGIGVAEEEGSFVATGTEVPTVIAKNPAEGVALEVLPEDSLATPCEEKNSSPEEEAEGAENTLEQEEQTSVENCELPEGQGGNFALNPVEVIPLKTSEDTNGNAVVRESAVIDANTAVHVDTIIRPLYEGVLTFQAIRDASASEKYSWEVNLSSGQELKLLNDQHAAVYYPNGSPAFGITAEPAHDAIGTSVPTTLELGGSTTITLDVHHRSSSFVYPVLAGMGWQGGYISTQVEGPKDEQELKEERERIEREEREAREAEESGEESSAIIDESGANVVVDVAVMGPPVASASAEGDPTSGPAGAYTFAHKFKFNQCRYNLEVEIPEPSPEIPGEWRREATSHCQSEIGSPSHIRLIAGMAVHGWFHDNQLTKWVWIRKGNLHCDKWGEEQPAMVNCEKRPNQPSHVDIHLLGDYRFPPEKGNFYTTAITSACDTVRGRLEVGPTYHQEDAIIRPARAAFGSTPGEPCPWP